jgi:uncharacterized protein YjiS (DUF1127 family)
MTTAAPDHLTGRRPRRARGRMPWAFVSTTMQRVVAALAVQWQVRQAIRELESFDDHRLRDLGLTRQHIERAVRFGRDRDIEASRAASPRHRAHAA